MLFSQTRVGPNWPQIFQKNRDISDVFEQKAVQTHRKAIRGEISPGELQKHIIGCAQKRFLVWYLIYVICHTPPVLQWSTPPWMKRFFSGNFYQKSCLSSWERNWESLGQNGSREYEIDRKHFGNLVVLSCIDVCFWWVFNVESPSVDQRFFEIESSVPRKVTRKLSPNEGKLTAKELPCFLNVGKF